MGVVFMGVVLTEDEAVDLLIEASNIAALVGGLGSGSKNLDMVRDFAREWQLKLLGMYSTPGRLHVRCSECGQHRESGGQVPDGVAGYALVPVGPNEPSIPSPPAEEQI